MRCTSNYFLASHLPRLKFTSCNNDLPKHCLLSSRKTCCWMPFLKIKKITKIWDFDARLIDIFIVYFQKPIKMLTIWLLPKLKKAQILLLKNSERLKCTFSFHFILLSVLTSPYAFPLISSWHDEPVQTDWCSYNLLSHDNFE